GLLLIWSGVPIVLLYLWQALIQPLVFGSELGDFQGSYMRAAARLASGRDPFDLCQAMGCLEPTGPQYVTPLPLAWLLQPGGGVALGLAVALKLIQAPVGLLLLWARRWAMLAAAAVAGLGLWLLAAPQYLLEYLLKVVPAIGQGTGLFENHSPGGTIARLLE